MVDVFNEVLYGQVMGLFLKLGYIFFGCYYEYLGNLSIFLVLRILILVDVCKCFYVRYDSIVVVIFR